MAGNDSGVRLWGYVSTEADRRIRLLALVRAVRGTVGRICGDAVDEFLERHRQEHDRIIAIHRTTGERATWAGPPGGDCRVWAYVSQAEQERLLLLAFIYRVPKSEPDLLITQAVYEYLEAHWEQHDASIRAYLATQEQDRASVRAEVGSQWSTTVG